jgi:uncharacterized low-complexity protein
MRRLMLAVAVTAALVLSTAAPAVAAPTKNPNAFTVTVTCDGVTWEATTNGKVGWPLDGPAGATRGIMFGGTHTVEFGGQVYTEEYAPPPGLAGKLQTCRIERPLQPNGYSLWDPAYVLPTPQ